MIGPSLDKSTTMTTTTTTTTATIASTSLFLRVVLLATIIGGHGMCNAGWVDPDTPDRFLVTSANNHEDTREYELVRRRITMWNVGHMRVMVGRERMRRRLSKITFFCHIPEKGGGGDGTIGTSDRAARKHAHASFAHPLLSPSLPPSLSPLFLSISYIAKNKTKKQNPFDAQVFSDEFEQDGRSFEDGADPRWTAIDKNDCEFPHVVSFRRGGEGHAIVAILAHHRAPLAVPT